jgi:hypothetical protein
LLSKYASWSVGPVGGGLLDQFDMLVMQRSSN